MRSCARQRSLHAFVKNISADDIFCSKRNAFARVSRTRVRRMVEKLAKASSSSRNLVKTSASHCFWRSEEHTSELQSLMSISYAVFCLKTKIITQRRTNGMALKLRALIQWIYLMSSMNLSHV